MKPARLLAILAIAAFFTGAPANDVVLASESNPPAPTAPTPPPTAPTTNPTAAPTTAASAIDQIRQAPVPSSTIDAFTRARVADPANLELEKAYVHRMVELNAPELADAQARDVVERDASDGVAQAVTGYMAAAHGESGQAAQKLEIAVRMAPGEPFVMRTDAQVVAWYDAQTDHSKLSQRDVQAIEALRAAGANNPVYADAYRTASELQRGRQQAAATPGAMTTMPTNSSEATLPPSTPPAPSDVSPYSYANAPSYYYTPQPSQMYVYYYPDPYAYGPWYPGPWGFWGGGIIVDDFFFVHHDRFFDHDGRFFDHERRFFHDGRFDHDGRFFHDGRFDHDGRSFHDGRFDQGRGDGIRGGHPMGPPQGRQPHGDGRPIGRGSGMGRGGGGGGGRGGR